MQRFKTVLCIVITSLWLSHSAYADDDWFNQPQGFDSDYLSSVVDIQNRGRNNDRVILQGRLTNYLGKENYEFTDIKGDRIEVELDDDVDWSLVHRDQLISIAGELDKNMFTVKVEAKQYTILQDEQYMQPAAQNSLEATSSRRIVASPSYVYPEDVNPRTRLAPEPAPINSLNNQRSLQFGPVSKQLNHQENTSLPQLIDSTIMNVQQQINTDNH